MALGLWVIAFAVGFPLYGLAVSRLWEWFVVPQFGAPPVSLAEGYGLALLVGLLTAQYIPKSDEGDDGWLSAIHSVVVPVAALGIGWAVKSWWL